MRSFYSSNAWGKAFALAIVARLFLIGVFGKDPSFMLSNTNFAQVRGGAMAWGDFDNDGYLDLVVTGDLINNNAVTVLYRNNGDRTFTPMPFNFAGVRS